MARVRRPLVLTTLAVSLLAIGATAPGAAARPAERSAPARRVTFSPAVPLSSFSPLRTLMSHAYSVSDGAEPSQHEWNGEPGIEVDRFGTIYASGVCCVVAASPVWVSRDGGATFSELETPGHVREWTVGSEGDLAVDDAGRVFFADTTVSTIQFTRWSAEGRSWDFTAPALGVIPGANDRPWLAWSRPYLYLFINHITHVQIYRSPDGGDLWQTSGPLTWQGSTDGQPFFPGHIAADAATGTLWVTGLVPGPDGRQVLGSAVSTDGAQTFQENTVYTPAEGEAISPIFSGIVTVDPAGTAYTTWSIESAQGCQVVYASSSDLGQTWSAPKPVSAGPGCATFPWIDAGTPGEVALAYYRTPVTAQQDPPVSSDFQDNVPPDAPWEVHVAVVKGADTAAPTVADGTVPFANPVFLGPLGRQGWDYLGVDFGPDGKVRAIFAEKYQDSAPRTWFVSTKRAY